VGVTRGATSSVGRPSRAAAALGARALGAAVAVTDLTPPGIRYGYVHRAARLLLRRPLASLGPVEGVRFSVASSRTSAAPSALRCGLLADALDVGGVGRVVEMLAEGLPGAGIVPVVVCPVDGSRAAHLRALGVEVLVVPPGGAAGDVLARARLDVVELHSAPRHLVDAALELGVPLVPVLHNTEIHYDAPTWRRTGELFDRSAVVVAVSDVVRRYHLRRLGRYEITVVPNGTPGVERLDGAAVAAARRALDATVGADTSGDVVVACLARYDSQKNVAGLVSAFLRAVAVDPRLRLVVAGDPSDWLEHRRADAIRRADRHADRVHLLGPSDAAATLAAADVFVLDSFFEGWPLAATEAVALGLPVVLSDAGGTAELVARAVAGSALVPNPTGPAELVTDRSARAARRAARRQGNAPDVAAALVSAAVTVRETGRSAPPMDDGYDAMVAGHAVVLHGLRPAPGSHRAHALADGLA
jgi:glycosyltransferase involved in cell wall biosynthesis